MEFDALRRTWDRFGEIDPLGAILTEAERTGRWTAEPFFATGREEIAEVLAILERAGVTLARRRALDFGCGVGRLTQALGEVFEECHGVDVAASMIRHAERFNRLGARVRYHLNERSDLRLFADGGFDFVYSNLVLQHMRPEYAHGYLREFVRILVPKGVLVFQLPAEPRAVSAPAALPAYRAAIEVASAPAELAGGGEATIAVRVRNVGDTSWPGGEAADPQHWIALGNHWLDRTGATVANDDGRTPLPQTVAPGQELRLDLRVRAPAKPGSYLLEIDLVHENVCWFGSTGSPTARVAVRVGGAAAPEAPAPPPPATDSGPVMEVYGTPRAQVVALLEAAGARVIDVQRYDAAGPTWVSYRYLAEKR